jgi:hypothetical protein
MNKKIYQLGPTFLDLFPSLNVTIQQLRDIYKNDPVNAEWMSVYEPISKRNQGLVYKFLKHTANKPEFSTIEDYKHVMKFMIESQYLPQFMPNKVRYHCYVSKCL